MENGVAANIVLYRYGIKVFAVRKSIFRLVFGTGGVIAVGTGSNQKHSVVLISKRLKIDLHDLNGTVLTDRKWLLFYIRAVGFKRCEIYRTRLYFNLSAYTVANMC